MCLICFTSLAKEIFYDDAIDMIGKWYLFPNYEATHKEVMEKYSEAYHDYKSTPFIAENRGCVEMKPTQYLVSIGVSEAFDGEDI